MARRIAEAIGQAPKLLLTATPLQNSLMELYGLVSVIDDHVFGDAATFRDQFVRAVDETSRNAILKSRACTVLHSHAPEASGRIHPVHQSGADHAGLLSQAMKNSGCTKTFPFIYKEKR